MTLSKVRLRRQQPPASQHEWNNEQAAVAGKIYRSNLRLIAILESHHGIHKVLSS